MATTRELLDQALELDRTDRASLARELIASLDEPLEAEGDVEAAWLDEVEHRLAAVQDGRAKTVPWHEARARILKRLSQG